MYNDVTLDHPVQEQKNIIKAFEASATKLEQELRVLEAAFDRVQGSVNKQLKDMLLKEYPEEYLTIIHRSGGKYWWIFSHRH